VPWDPVLVERRLACWELLRDLLDRLDLLDLLDLFFVLCFIALYNFSNLPMEGRTGNGINAYFNSE
jgi:hypothetical protein